jgi:hypothetical protein
MDRVEPALGERLSATRHPDPPAPPPVGRDEPPPRPGLPWGWLGAAALLVLAGAGGWYWFMRAPAEPAPLPRAEAPAAAPAAPPPIEHPLPPSSAAPSLPALGQSDPLMADTLNALLGAPAVQKLLVTQSFARRFVAFIDNLPREKLPRQEAPLRPAAGALRVSGSGEARTLDAANAARYAPYVAIAESVDPVKLVDAYVRLYPVFQQAYEELGYPQRYFNDRVVQAIDHLLLTPEVKGPLALVQPKVHYEFADPQLESLTAAQKALLRTGPDNAARLKARLRAVRAEIIRNSSAR